MIILKINEILRKPEVYQQSFSGLELEIAFTSTCCGETVIVASEKEVSNLLRSESFIFL